MYVAMRMSEYAVGHIKGVSLTRFVATISNECIGKRLVIIDVDGTLRDPSHRLHLLPPPYTHGRPSTNEMYISFNEAGNMDKPLVCNIKKIRSLLTPRGDIVSVVLTSSTSSDATRGALKTQLRKWDIQTDAIFMRSIDNQTPNPQFKRDFMASVDNFGVDPSNILAIDDCRDTCQMFHDIGITPLQV